MGLLQQDQQIGHAGYGGLALTDADGFDNDDVESCTLTQQHRLTRVLRDAS